MNKEQLLSTVCDWNRHIQANELSDFRITKLAHGTLCLAGSFDLCYYHDVELTVTGVVRLVLDCEFYVDLAQPEPFSLRFPGEETGVLCFWDCGAGQAGEIWFEGEIFFRSGHVSYK